MSKSLKTYGLTFFIFLIIDLVWLVFISPSLYKEHIGHLLADEVNFGAAFIFYVLFIGGLVFFVINPALQKNDRKFALSSGAFFGLICYATYDLTNLATLKNWSVLITVIDLIWGSFICAITSVLTVTIISKLRTT